MSKFAWYCVRGESLLVHIQRHIDPPSVARAFTIHFLFYWRVLPPHVQQSQHFVTHLRLICIVIKQWKFIKLPDSWSRNSLKEEKRRSLIHHKEFVFGYWNILHTCTKRTTDRLLLVCVVEGLVSVSWTLSLSGIAVGLLNLRVLCPCIKDCYTFTWRTNKCTFKSMFNYIS